MVRHDGAQTIDEKIVLRGDSCGDRCDGLVDVEGMIE
jgi:hypothetical protein